MLVSCSTGLEEEACLPLEVMGSSKEMERKLDVFVWNKQTWLDKQTANIFFFYINHSIVRSRAT